MALSYLCKIQLNDNNIVQNIIKRWALPEDIKLAEQKKLLFQKLNFLSARAILRALLFSQTGHNGWKIKIGYNGKPYIYDKHNNIGPYISLSHTQNIVACALSYYAPIGIDVEQCKQRDFNAISAMAFGQEEQKEIRENGISAFYKIWTLREAISKSTGEGLQFVMNNADNVANIKTPYCFIKNHYLYHYTHPQQDYSLAVVLYSHKINYLKNIIKHVDFHILDGLSMT